jgi:hypothetical protein
LVIELFREDSSDDLSKLFMSHPALDAGSPIVDIGMRCHAPAWNDETKRIITKQIKQVIG